MIFSLQYVLIFGGYGAVSSLSGNYINYYTKADDFQLGLYFMIPHFLHVARPFIGAQADRNASYKRVYTWCALIAGISYLPYIVLPFLLKDPGFANTFTNTARFWVLVFCHVTGSIGLNGCRAMSDALAKNYARRLKVEYVTLRKYAPVGLGLFGYSFGFFNEGSILPNYVPAMMLFSSCMFLLCLIVHLWPDEYFVIMSSDNDDMVLPTTSEIATRFVNRIARPFRKESYYVKQLRSMTFEEKNNDKEIDTKSAKSEHIKRDSTDTTTVKIKLEQIPQTKIKPLSLGQQMGILGVVMRRDFRISLALIVLFFGGWICRAAQNFVFVQLEDICVTTKTCQASKLSGDILAGISATEFATYVVLNLCRGFKLNRLALLEMAILSVSIHYYFFGFFIEHLSSRWFLVESLQGFEFAIFITTCLGWGYSFAQEVEYVIPELKERNIISERDDINLVKVSLVATMMSCMTLLYEGFGSTMGSFVYGVLIKRYSYSVAWNINGFIALLEFLIIILCLLANRCLKLKPKMTKLKNESLKIKNLEQQ